jgi:hypothetical protein
VTTLADEFMQRGIVILRGLVDPALLRRAWDESTLLAGRRDLISTRNLRCRFRPHVANASSLFETYDPITDLSPAAAAIAADTELLAALQQLYGEAADLFKDKLIYKPAGCPGYPLHQDWIAWPGFPRSFLTVLVPYERATLANGCTIAYAGYHRDGSLSLADGEFHELPSSLVDEARAVPLELDPGDVAIFSGFTPHRSSENRSAGSRRQLYLSYNRRSEGGDQRGAHYEEFHRWLRRRLPPESGDFTFE